MSETPQERIEKWLAEVTGWGQEVVGQFAPAEVRDAIRAVLADTSEYERGRAEEYGRTCQERKRWETLLQQAEAERDALRVEVERLRDAMAAFRSDRGRHEGQHDFTGGGIACVLCDKAYIDAEAKLDEALRDTAPAAKSPLDAALAEAKP